ncbi:MAG: hypothetical protein BWX60_00119 [Candidatus Marinimicrobia bacterium ADurb.Bin030]|nr:MAG: hypothetical protein BWX60_00119 [Candidatus Marinimicrobia bacterium ADurb.Bin030]
MLGVNVGRDAVFLLRFGNDMQGERGFTAGFRPVNLHHTAARNTERSQRDIEAQRAGGNGRNISVFRTAQLHNRALAELFFYLSNRQINGL